MPRRLYSNWQLTQVSYISALIVYSSYDPLWLVTSSSEQTALQTYSFRYSYNLAVALTSETYPSGLVITNSYYVANHISQMTGYMSVLFTNYITSVNYWSHGAPYYYAYGYSLVPVFQYNDRLEMYVTWGAVYNDPNIFLFYEPVRSQ